MFECFYDFKAEPWVKTDPHKCCKKNVFQVSAEKIHSCSETVTKLEVTCIVKFRHVSPARRCLPDAYPQLQHISQSHIAGWLGFVWQRYVRVYLRLSWTLRDLEQPQPLNRAMEHYQTVCPSVRSWQVERFAGCRWKAFSLETTKSWNIMCVFVRPVGIFFFFLARLESVSAGTNRRIPSSVNMSFSWTEDFVLYCCQ